MGEGGFTKNQYKGRGDCLKRGASTVCRFKGGGGGEGLARKKGVVILRGD